MEQIRSMLLGMVVAVVLLLLMGTVGGSGPGRYQMAGAGGSCVYVLDTHTGKITAAGGYAGFGAGVRAREAADEVKSSQQVPSGNPEPR